MSVFDLIIIAILAALTLRGIWKGMVSQIVSVASYVVCWIVATRFGSLVAPTIPLEAPWDQVAAMAIVFLITLVGIRFAQTALEKLIKDWHLEKLNKSLGGLLGFAKGLLLCLIITFFAVMLSDTSRAVVFNSKTGSHLVQLLTRISLFVPKDSYEFVHTQFEQFHSKIDGVVPGQTPGTVPVQSSETVQQVFAKLQGKSEPSASSLMTALSNWWSGSKADTPNADVNVAEVETLVPTSQAAQTNLQSQRQAVTYMPPLPEYPAKTFTNVPLPATPNRAISDYFVRQVTPASVPVPNSQPSLSPLPILTPLSETLSVLQESTQLSPSLPMPSHVGSDLLLHNSGRATNPNASASLYRIP
ncbi:MAG: CvpA family protein [Planctomycetaceae bacterium]|nr:CvpA family protein [Planctomycetaceae bacterium]